MDVGAEPSDLAMMLKAIESGDLAELAAGADGIGVDLARGVPDPRQIFRVGVNHLEHRRETGRSDTEFPTISGRLPASQIGHDEAEVRIDGVGALRKPVVAA